VEHTDHSPYIIIQRQNKNHALLGYYTVIIGNFLPRFRDNLLVPSSRVQNLFAVSTLEDLFWNTVNFLDIWGTRALDRRYHTCTNMLICGHTAALHCTEHGQIMSDRYCLLSISLNFNHVFRHIPPQHPHVQCECKTLPS